MAAFPQVPRPQHKPTAAIAMVGNAPLAVIPLRLPRYPIVMPDSIRHPSGGQVARAAKSASIAARAKTQNRSIMPDAR